MCFRLTEEEKARAELILDDLFPQDVRLTQNTQDTFQVLDHQEPSTQRISIRGAGGVDTNVVTYQGDIVSVQQNLVKFVESLFSAGRDFSKILKTHQHIRLDEREGENQT